MTARGEGMGVEAVVYAFACAMAASPSYQAAYFGGMADTIARDVKALRRRARWLPEDMRISKKHRDWVFMREQGLLWALCRAAIRAIEQERAVAAERAVGR